MEWIRKAIAVNPNNPDAYSNLGEACRATGRLDEAIANYRQAVELKPGFAEVHYNLGSALRERGQFKEAVDAFRRALELKPAFAEAHNNLGVALRDGGQLEEAITAYRRALELKPDNTEVHNNLGVALRDRGQLEEAIAACRHALQLKPDFPEALNNLGNALRDRGQLEEAIAAFHRVVTLKPGDPKAHYNLGNALREQGQPEEAIAAFRRALQLKPDDPDVHINLGNALREQGQFEEAIVAYRRALLLKPDYSEVHINLGNALRDRGQLDEAVAAYRRALQLEPDFPEALNNLGNALKDQGALDDAIAAYRQALRNRPEDARAHSNLIYALHLHPAQDHRTISEEHERWNRRFGDPLKQYVRPHANSRNPQRRLRVGYVSPDLRDHPVGRYLLPLFERHAREQFEILCYSGAARSDWMTERLRALAGGWRSTVGVPDERLAEMIREDGVDILVDLAMHTAGNRLPVFARQPAPVQVTWLGYPGSTGLHSIGYRLTDAHMEPPGEGSRWSAEEAIRLPDFWCCYDPVAEYPEITALPALSVECVTFGSLNNFAKVNEGVLTLWARVLRAATGSRLVMRCPEGRTRERVSEFFGAQGIAKERVELVGIVFHREYLRFYQRIDLGLDTFPYNGMSTTCDSLWMGVPVLTMPGTMPLSRLGFSLLSSAGLGDLVASSEEDYVRLAVELAGNLPRLAGLRTTLRARMQDSPLMDAPRFALNVEAAYRAMWQAWCAGQSPIRQG